ncbi:hypothetical protein Emed_000722 [Eimeria media]
MAAKTSAFVGSGVATVGGEAPIEQCPQEKFCIESDSPLCDSKMWKMLDNYYKRMAIEAWAHDYVPSFVTSNSRLCRSYAKIIINFLQDWFKRPEADPTKPVTILEIGGGHGRFTFLLLRAMKRYQRFFASLGLPEKPFLFVFSDVAEANVAFCSKHPALKEFVDMQWLDFAVFDGNKAREVPLVVKGKPLVNGAAPVIAICNYVLDSLLTDAWRVTPGAAESEFERALVSIYSPIEEEQMDAPDIMPRMTLGWKWRKVHLDAACKAPSSEGIEYLQKDTIIKEVLLQYRKLNKQLSFVLPIGAFSLFQNLLHIGGGRLFCLVGDKGYPTADEFEGARDPHIAIHGSVSFMLNIHAIRSYFECMGGFSHATPYRDTFQVTGLWLCGTEFEMGRSVTAFLENVEELAPDALITWQRVAQETVAAGGGPASNIKSLISLLRHSGHDSDVFLNFAKEFTSQCVHPYLNSRTEHDLIADLEEVFSNWYRLKKGEDVADICGHICMHLGRCDKALKFLKASADLEGVPTHSSTYINIASCCKVEGDFQAGLKYCAKALELNPNYPQAIQMQRTLHMCINPVKVALIGCGYWALYEALPLLRRDKRFKIVAVFSFKEKEVSTLVQMAELEGVEQYSGSQGLSSLLERDDIQVVVVDVHMQLVGSAVLDVYKPYHKSLVWHAVENNRQEEAFAKAAGKLAALGPLTSVSFKCVTDTALKTRFSVAPYDIKHHMALDLLRCLAAIRELTGLHMSSISATVVGDHAPCCSQSSSQEDSAENDAPKETRQRPEFARLNGWLTLVDANTKGGNGWRIEVFSENPSGSTSFAVQSIGHQNCHDAFAEDLYEKIYSADKSVSLASAKDGPAMVDVSINGALADSAVIEGILASIQHAGVPARFGCPEGSTTRGTSLHALDKKAPTTELHAASCF